jgi:hypothetical protein
MMKKLIRLYWQIDGIDQVINNEFMHWFVKGYIIEEIGENMNWAKVASTRVQEKT